MIGRVVVGVVLGLSLAANLFLGGWVVAARNAETPATGARGMMGRALMSELRALPEAERSRALAVVRQYGPQLRQRAEALREARAGLRTLAGAEHYSRAELEARFAQVREETTALQAQAQSMMLDLADTLSADARARVFGRADLGQ